MDDTKEYMFPVNLYCSICARLEYDDLYGKYYCMHWCSCNGGNSYIPIGEKEE